MADKEKAPMEPWQVERERRKRAEQLRLRTERLQLWHRDCNVYDLNQPPPPYHCIYAPGNSVVIRDQPDATLPYVSGFGPSSPEYTPQEPTSPEYTPQTPRYEYKLPIPEHQAASSSQATARPEEEDPLEGDDQTIVLSIHSQHAEEEEEEEEEDEKNEEEDEENEDPESDPESTITTEPTLADGLVYR